MIRIKYLIVEVLGHDHLSGFPEQPAGEAGDGRRGRRSRSGRTHLPVEPGREAVLGPRRGCQDRGRPELRHADAGLAPVPGAPRAGVAGLPVRGRARLPVPDRPGAGGGVKPSGQGPEQGGSQPMGVATVVKQINPASSQVLKLGI